MRSKAGWPPKGVSKPASIRGELAATFEAQAKNAGTGDELRIDILFSHDLVRGHANAEYADIVVETTVRGVGLEVVGVRSRVVPENIVGRREMAVAARAKAGSLVGHVGGVGDNRVARYVALACIL